MAQREKERERVREIERERERVVWRRGIVVLTYPP